MRPSDPYSKQGKAQLLNALDTLITDNNALKDELTRNRILIDKLVETIKKAKEENRNQR